MTSRLQALLIVVLAIPGLLGRQVSVVMHEHDGGADPHHHHAHHAPLVGYVEHSHPHEDDAKESEPSSEEWPSDDDGLPDDGDRHGHYRAVQVAALRRSVLEERAADRHVDAPFSRLALAHEQPSKEAFGPPPSPGDSRGHPPSRTGRTIDRLVQGIGLLI